MPIALLSPTRTATRSLVRSTLYLRAMSTSPASSASAGGAEPLVLATKSASQKVAILTLNRPKALNALSSPLFEKLNEELEKADQDDGVHAIVITGGDKAFAAGADIKEMKDKTCMLLFTCIV